MATPPFEYQVRHADLQTAPDWKPHQSWDDHYAKNGLEDRDQQLEDYLASIRGSFGFLVHRSNNEASLANGGASRNITFDVCDIAQGGWLTAGAISASSFTVPASGTGVYMATGFAYLGASVSLAFLSVDVANLSLLTQNATSNDRISVAGGVYLRAGDVVTLRAANYSFGAFTITAIGADGQTPTSPMLSLWRVSS